MRLRPMRRPEPPRGSDIRTETATEQSAAILDPLSWTRRHTAFTGVAIAVAALASLIGQGSDPSAAHGLRTFAGAVLGGGVILLAASLPRISLVGLYVGLSVTSAAILAWTHPERPAFVWAVQGMQILVLAIWTFPWMPHVRLVPRLGAAWTGLSYWIIGMVGAVLTGLVLSDRKYFTVSAQRATYLLLAVVTILAVIKASSSPHRSVSIGLTAAFLVTLGVLFILGSSNLFEAVHAAPNNSGARFLENRFWGGAGVFYHPVSLAGIAVAASMRVVFDRMFRVWQRVATAAVAPLAIVVTQTRTAAVLVVACVAVTIVLRARALRLVGDGAHRPSPRLGVLAVAALVVFLAGASFTFRSDIKAFFTVERYADAPLAKSYGRAEDVTSGRIATWKQVFREFRTDRWTEKLFGSAERARATVVRPGDDPHDPVTVLTDNAAVGALRRGGLFGVAAFLIGLVLLVRRALRSGVWWFQVAAVASLATIPTTDWLLGSPLWYLLLSGEVAAVLAGAPDLRPSSPAAIPDATAHDVG